MVFNAFPLSNSVETRLTSLLSTSAAGLPVCCLGRTRIGIPAAAQVTMAGLGEVTAATPAADVDGTTPVADVDVATPAADIKLTTTPAADIKGVVGVRTRSPLPRLVGVRDTREDFCNRDSFVYCFRLPIPRVRALSLSFQSGSGSSDLSFGAVASTINGFNFFD
mmetsp:Transcript_17927/g.44659  ORF Transcript_17927/g.44659 Transcript_17927/m.44659 type:complete len:165 (-) Transcript_17927:1983-2477(-)